MESAGVVSLKFPNMKTNSLLFICLLFLVESLLGQNASFPTDNAVWKYYFRFGGENTYGSAQEQEIIGDSLFGGKGLSSGNLVC